MMPAHPQRGRIAGAGRGDTSGLTSGTSFDLFGTLVAAQPVIDPAAAIADELRCRGLDVPDDWSAAYEEMHLPVPPGGELSLVDHIAGALHSRQAVRDPAGGEYRQPIEQAVVGAFDRPIRTRNGAVEAVRAARDRGPVAVLSNCSVPGLAGRAIERSELERDDFDAVVTSIDCGWRKPDSRAFQAVVRRLGIPLRSLVHVGDDPSTDGGADAAGATAVSIDEVSLSALPARFDRRTCPR